MSDSEYDEWGEGVMVMKMMVKMVVDVYNLKKQFKVQIIGILEEKDSFYWPKCSSEKLPKNLGRASPHPAFGQNPKEQEFFLIKPSLYENAITKPINIFALFVTRIGIKILQLQMYTIGFTSMSLIDQTLADRRSYFETAELHRRALDNR